MCYEIRRLPPILSGRSLCIALRPGSLLYPAPPIWPFSKPGTSVSAPVGTAPVLESSGDPSSASLRRTGRRRAAADPSFLVAG